VFTQDYIPHAQHIYKHTRTAANASAKQTAPMHIEKQTYHYAT